MDLFTNLKNAIRNLPRRGQRNVVKILCLAFGLAAGSVLIAEVYFEQSFDTFFPGYQRTYNINEAIIRDGKYDEYDNTSGAIAQGVKKYAPQVEAATRFTDYGDMLTYQTNDGKILKTDFNLADSCFFDVVQGRVLQGNAKQTLSRPYYCMINRTMAEKLGGDVIGRQLRLKEDSINLVIGGVFEDIPLNSQMRNMEIITSLSTLSKMWGGQEDGSENWEGNDRYTSLIRLTKGCKIEDLRPAVEKMRKENLPMSEMKKAGVDLNYTFTQISKTYTSQPNIKMMCWILSLLAFLLLSSSLMNYLLIVVGNMVTRSREMAIRKCYGAGRRRIHSIIFSETFVHLVIAIAIGALLLFACKGTIQNLLSAPLSVLIFNRGSWILGAICIVVLLVGGLVPGWLYSSVPVATAFRGYNESRHHWKLILLSVQFIIVGLMVCLLVVVNKQYNMMINDNPGYEYHDLASVFVLGANSDEKAKLINELKSMPDVASVTTGSVNLLNTQSGNNIYLPGDDREYLNIADLYSVSDDYLSTMKIKIVQGRNFTQQTDSMKEIMVSQSFVDTMKVAAHWNNEAVGRKVIVSEHSDRGHGLFTICGVYQNIRVGTLSMPETRPTIMFYSKKPQYFIFVKFHNLNDKNMSALRHLVSTMFPDKSSEVLSYSTLVANHYQTQSNFRTGILAEGLITLFIALLGLVGYSNDEVNRRRKEIAIRKINGAEVSDILRIFTKDIVRFALPSLILGAVGAYLIARKWLELFSQRVSLNFFIFAGCVLLLLIIIIAVMIGNCYRIANNNPVNYIKEE
jgi:putative ABC transport system permease protein